MTLVELTEEQYSQTLRLFRAYRREAKRCAESKAYLAGCVMLGAALETLLLTTANCFPEEVSSVHHLPTSKGKPKPLLQWSLADLLRVAKQLRWLPSELSLGDNWDRRRAKVGDYAEVLRMVRNLIHPGYYVEHHSPSRVTRKYLEHWFDVLQAAATFLGRKCEDAVREQLYRQHLGSSAIGW
ncbi:MAG: hypothetical protein HY236_09275 [Acidobacteria bacterium]|nr:hypothetical protein [Acidobacteriota bacterium]